MKKAVSYQKTGQKEFMINVTEQIEEHFSHITGLIGEKSRAIILWTLLDGKAYTATELAVSANISPTAASNHLSKLVGANLLIADKQGRHRYYRFANDNVALVIENIAGLLPIADISMQNNEHQCTGIKYARTCYDHLAGKVAVDLTKGLLHKEIIVIDENQYHVTTKGKVWFNELGIDINLALSMKRKLAFPCLDWSERKHHLGGALGALLLDTMITKDWIRKVKQSREVIITGTGKTALYNTLDLMV